jgi:hypothetical protein
MSRGLISDDIINEVRALCDEYDTDQLPDTDIYASLNRGMEKSTKILSRVYPDPIMQYIEISLPSTREIDLPENIWGDKIIRMEWYDPNNARVIPTECQKVSVRLLAEQSQYLGESQIPLAYAIHGRTIRFCATPSGKRSLRIWNIREIDKLVKTHARITDLDTTNGILYLGEVSSSFDPFGTVVQGDWNSYINIVDGQTGIVKGTFQIKSWDETDTLEIKLASPDRSLVLNRPIDTSLSTTDINADDYICPIQGTCVLYFCDEVHAYIVQYATAECKRRLGYAYDADQNLLREFEIELKKTYQGRSLSLRIVQNNPNWMKGARRQFYRGYRS